MDEFDPSVFVPLERNPASIPPPPRAPDAPPLYITSLDEYHTLWKESVNRPEKFWGDIARSELTWFREFTTVCFGRDGDIAWFPDGFMNIAYNCVDRHAAKTPTKTALIWESDEPGQHIHISYGELLKQVCLVANVLKSFGVRKGDVVAIYLPMVPELVYAMLACARIGAIHSVVFAGFSAEALRERINDAKCRVVITADQGRRGGKTIHTKRLVDEALLECRSVEKVIVFQRTGEFSIPFHPTRDAWWHEEISKQRPYCPCEWLSAEDPFTGAPKGLLHTSAGYLLCCMMTSKYVFDYHPESDVLGCMVDLGWITGASYIVYGPLGLGGTSLIFESVPTYPSPSRYWQIVQSHHISHFLVAPTTIRALRRLGDQHVEPFDLSSLRVIGTTGEPIGPDAWGWLNKKIGKERCSVLDAYWQTEAIMIAPLAFLTPTKPGSATLPFFGIDPAVIEPSSGKELKGNSVTGVLAIKSPWPSIARTLYSNHSRYISTYMRTFTGCYFTGDGVTRDSDGYYWIRGRLDDVINVSGHRLSTQEVESALLMFPLCAEAAVVGVPDEVTGQAVFCFVTLREQPNAPVSALTSRDLLENNRTGASSDTLLSRRIIQALSHQVKTAIGPFATPKRIVIVPELPKTRSGKILRRLLRIIASGQVKTSLDADVSKLGDVSTLSDTSILPILISRVHDKAF
ncbi:acetate--CoA ligase [Gonapodya prolifera JEL478]|uniref:Acetyl-coenzyme A synthetase n=1 Tax=Gonapodya prolifera (strain JEL478) TaxID=1344416 RepID=A0A139A9X5_GONPJ|nr:acetate--CoA ligase [Gonapodya prolifera JEL478]|eukprot:KXS13652.1 acetate--CoA ligase [Gonapodya prolifera JEL478]